MKWIAHVVPLLLLLPFAAQSEEAAKADEWTGTGELGLAVSRGNTSSENFNAKLAAVNETADWTHKFGLSALRARNQVTEVDAAGNALQRYELSANRYQLSTSSAYKMTPRASWLAALRYENDDFAAFEHQTTFSLGYGYRLIDNEQTRLAAELGPGYRSAKRRSDGQTEGDLILRGLVEYRQKLTENTALTNQLLVESGDDNTFAQNDFGVTVAMNNRLALKTGLQIRHNTEVQPGTKRTDSLSTVNLVYSLK
jgi:putative salt-induced outer membrane protein